MRAIGRYVGLLRRYVGPEWRRASVLTALLGVAVGLQLLSPQLLRFFIDEALGGAPVEPLVFAALAFIGLALVQQLVAAAAGYVGEDLGWIATNRLRADLSFHLLRLDMGFHKARTPGELVERIDGDVTALASFFSRFAVNVVSSFVLLIGVIVVVTLEDVRAGAALGAFAAVAVALLVGPLRTITVKYWRRVREVSAQLFGALGEWLSGTEDIRSSGAEAHVMNGLALHHRSRYAAMRAAMAVTSVLVSTNILTFAIGSAIAFGVGGYLWSIGAVTLGTVYMLLYYTELLRRPIESLSRELEELQRAMASVGRIDELLELRSRIEDGQGVTLPHGALSVRIDRVSFAYESRAEDEGLVLRDVSLSLPPGRVLGVLGRTGSGKTTIARLLLRFYDPTHGSVRFGDVDLRDARVDHVRSRATLVTQDVQLFHASVRDNVTFFDRGITDDRITAVLERIGLGPWLHARGLDAEMTAAALSAGEAQLLAFARAFLRDPGLVVLDEASSRLDPATERQVERAIDLLLRDRTAVVIAHRLATLDRCDDVAILEEGRIVEYGPRAELAADPASRFARLLRTGLEPVLA